MMKQQIQVNEGEIVQKLAIYMFLQKFYAGQLNHMNKSGWENLLSALSKEISFDKVKKGIEILARFSAGDLEELEFDFNLLFVGPNRLEAPPYESTYRNDQRALMQDETLAVRRFYEKAGLVVSRKNIDPDDHLALELEFVCFLLENSIEDEMYDQLYQEFLTKHLFQWIESHCELIREKTKNVILIGISYILEGLILEEKLFEGGR